MSSPFGLAYGLGAGLTGIKGYMDKEQDRQVTAKMRDLQLAEMQRNADDEARQREIMARESGIENTETQVGTGQFQPQPEQPQMPQRMRGNIPEGMMPEQPQQPPQEIMRTIKAFATPQQHRAAILREKAAELMQGGLIHAAFRNEDLADKLEEQHMKVAREGLERAMSLKDADAATQYVQGLGAKNVISVEPDDKGGAMIISRDPNGGTHQVKATADDMVKIISGKDLSEIWRGINTRNAAEQKLTAREGELDRRYEYLADEAKRKGEEFAKREERLKLEGEARLEIARKNAANKEKYGVGSGIVTRVMARKQNIIDMALKNGEPADPVAAENQAWKELRVTKGEITKEARYQAAKSIFLSNNANRKQKDEAKAVMDEMERGAIESEKTSTPKSQPAPTAQAQPATGQGKPVDTISGKGKTYTTGMAVRGDNGKYKVKDDNGNVIGQFSVQDGKITSIERL